MPKVSTLAGVSSQYQFKVFCPPSMADNSVSLLAAKSTQVLRADRVVVGNKERGAIGGTLGVLPLTH